MVQDLKDMYISTIIILILLLPPLLLLPLLLPLPLSLPLPLIMIDNYYFNNDNNKNNNIDIYFFTSTFPQPRYPGFGRVQKRPKTEGTPEYS